MVSCIFVYPRNLTHSYLRLRFSYTAKNSSLNLKHLFHLQKTSSHEARPSLLASTQLHQPPSCVRSSM